MCETHRIEIMHPLPLGCAGCGRKAKGLNHQQMGTRHAWSPAKSAAKCWFARNHIQADPQRISDTRQCQVWIEFCVFEHSGSSLLKNQRQLAMASPLWHWSHTCETCPGWQLRQPRLQKTYAGCLSLQSPGCLQKLAHCTPSTTSLVKPCKENVLSAKIHGNSAAFWAKEWVSACGFCRFHGPKLNENSSPNKQHASFHDLHLRGTTSGTSCTVAVYSDRLLEILGDLETESESVSRSYPKWLLPGANLDALDRPECGCDSHWSETVPNPSNAKQELDQLVSWESFDARARITNTDQPLGDGNLAQLVNHPFGLAARGHLTATQLFHQHPVQTLSPPSPQQRRMPRRSGQHSTK